MNNRPIKDMAASVRGRLYNLSKDSARPFQEVLQYFAMERFLFRLANSRHANRFVLKGALLFSVWGAPATRPTKDIDLLARMNNQVDAVVKVVRDVCRQEVTPDGLRFDVDSVSGQAIKEDADYSGVRVRFTVFLETARIPMQIDVGFGDVVTPEAVPMEYPTLLEFAAPRLVGYNRETVVAEKFEAMTKLGVLNSRLKDYYDLHLLSRQFDFDGPLLADAISQTFSNRNTTVDPTTDALTEAFFSDPDKQAQWRGFLRRSRLEHSPDELEVVVRELSAFLVPVAQAILDGRTFDASWPADGPWQSR